MSGRVVLAVSCLALGSGLTVGFTKYIVPPTVVTCAAPAETPTPTPTPAPPAASDEVVVEIRVKVPAATNSAGVFARDSSGAGQGTLVNTQKPLDLAIEGEGFFQVTLPSGELAYTRVGNFGTASDGGIVTAQGFRVSPEILIPINAVSVSVGGDGTVAVQTAGAPNASACLGQITLATFPNPGWMTPKGNGLFQESDRSGYPRISTPGQNGSGLIRQGFRERHSDRNAAALIELIRDLGQETNNNADGKGVRVRVLGKAELIPLLPTCGQ